MRCWLLGTRVVVSHSEVCCSRSSEVVVGAGAKLFVSLLLQPAHTSHLTSFNLKSHTSHVSVLPSNQFDPPHPLPLYPSASSSTPLSQHYLQVSSFVQCALKRRQLVNDSRHIVNTNEFNARSPRPPKDQRFSRTVPRQVRMTLRSLTSWSVAYMFLTPKRVKFFYRSRWPLKLATPRYST